MADFADYVKGKGLVLITGKKGSGKSHFAVSIIADLRKKYPEHKVYADITGLTIEGVEQSPEDWHDVPNNCTIFYDEIQLKAWADNSNTKINSDPRVKDMTLIRKQNKNIVLITQDPMFIHSALRKLVDYHYHLSHPFKDGKPKVFYFHGAMGTIDDKGLYQSHAMETFTHTLDKETSALYESIEPDAKHDQKRKIPKRIIYMICFIVALIFIGIPLAFWGLSKVGGFIFGAKDRGDKQMQEAKNASIDPQKAITGAVAMPASGVQPMQLPEDVARQQALELHKKYLTNYTVEVANDDEVRPSGIVMRHGSCRVINRFGDNLDVSQRLCKLMLKDPTLMPHSRQAMAVPVSQQYNQSMPASASANTMPPVTYMPASAPAPMPPPQAVTVHKL